MDIIDILHNWTEHQAMLVFAYSLIFFLVIDILSGALSDRRQYTMQEMGLNVFAFVNFLTARALMVGVWVWIFLKAFPGGTGFMNGMGFWTTFFVYMLVEEYAHYWIHRLSHSIPWLWRIHKAHHTPEHMNVTVTYRENWLWWALASNTYITAFFIWGGHIAPVVLAGSAKIIVGFLSHSGSRWDLALHKNRFTQPFMWVLERVVTLQDTHHAHHGIGKYGNGMTNYAPFLFIFDVIHRTGIIPHTRQEAFGVPKTVTVEPWYELLWWPVLKTAQPADLRPPTKADSEAQSRIYTSQNGRVTIKM